MSVYGFNEKLEKVEVPSKTNVYIKDDFLIIEGSPKNVAAGENGVWDFLNQYGLQNYVVISVMGGEGNSIGYGTAYTPRTVSDGLIYPRVMLIQSDNMIQLIVHNNDNQTLKMWARAVLLKVN
jgi:hypothetical protein